MGKEKISYYWENIPEEFQYMCLTQSRRDRPYCTEPIIQWVLDHMGDCDRYVTGFTPYDVIRWIDIAIDRCLFPVNECEETWLKYRKEIAVILNRAEELLLRVAPADFKTSIVSPKDDHEDLGKFSIIAFAQRLNVYFSLLFMYTEEWGKLSKQLNEVLDDTERNLSHLLTQDDADTSASLIAIVELPFTGTNAWEPIGGLIKDHIPSGRASELFARTYEQYVLFLNNLDRTSLNQEACDILCANAEKRLDKFRSSILSKEH